MPSSVGTPASGVGSALAEATWPIASAATRMSKPRRRSQAAPRQNAISHTFTMPVPRWTCRKGAAEATPIWLFAQRRLAAATFDMRLLPLQYLLLQYRYRVIRMLQIRLHVGRGTARESPDVRILYDRLVEVEDYRLDKRQDPAVVLTRIPSRRRGQHTRRRGPIKGHVVLLVRIHREVERRANRTQICLCAQPRVLRRIKVLPCYVHPGFLGIIADVGTCSLEGLAIDIDPRVARRVRCFPQDVRTVVNAVEVDPLAVVADPIVGRWRETGHRGKRRPRVDMRHYFIVLYARRDVIRPPHDAWDAPAAFERGSFLTPEWCRAGIWIGVQPS